MARDRRSVFLERRLYRRRRMMDALKLVSILGCILWVIPVAWPNGVADDVETVPMSHALFYVFGVWIVLILCSVVLTLLLRMKSVSDPETDEGGRL